MKNLLKYIYIIGIVWLIGFWSQDVFAEGCKEANKYQRETMNNDCVTKLCIWHSDGYCKAIWDWLDYDSAMAAKKQECMWAFWDEDKNSSYKQKWDVDFCDCISKWWTELAVAIPFVWKVWWKWSDRCIPKTASGQALPLLIWVIIQILNTVLLVWWFAMLIYAGVLYSMQDVKTAQKIMRWVFGAFALYGSLGMILKLINPALFG